MLFCDFYPKDLCALFEKLALDFILMRITFCSNGDFLFFKT